MTITPINAQVSLNVTASRVTIATGVTGGTTQITSMIITNTNASTARTVTILVKGTASAVANEIYTVTLPKRGDVGSTAILDLSKCPIVLQATETARGWQDVGTDVNVFASGFNQV